MKKILLISVAFLLIGLQFILQARSTLLYFDFLVNQDHISRELCIEKENAENNCQGKCHLKKVLKQDQKKQNDSHFTAEHIRVFQFFQDVKIDIPSTLNEQKILYSGNYLGLEFTSPILETPDQPPKQQS